MRRRLTVSDERLGITATWTGGGVAILVDDRSGRVIARKVVGEAATASEASAVLDLLVEDERDRRRARGHG